ncbi:MAG: hypothetical protein LH618_08590 [Saprospiraceae bacterium]|nr:hypothetical protein [Saprospiraceae bacterium]
MKHILTPGILLFFVVTLGNLVLFLTDARSIALIYFRGEETMGILKGTQYNTYHQKTTYNVEFSNDSNKYIAANRFFVKPKYKIGDTLHVNFERKNPNNAVLGEDWLWTGVLIHFVFTILITSAFIGLVRYLYKTRNID